MGFYTPKPLRRADEQDAKAVQQWLQTEYPANLSASSSPESTDSLG